LLEDDIEPLDPEVFRLTAVPKAVSKKGAKRRPAYARSWLPWLTNRQFDAAYPPITRLWLYLLIRSKEGRHRLSLTNAMAAEIGIDRYQKYRLLRQLERAGFVAVDRVGRSAPAVTVKLLPPPPCAD
jgi:hypothetical protein